MFALRIASINRGRRSYTSNWDQYNYRYSEYKTDYDYRRIDYMFFEPTDWRAKTLKQMSADDIECPMDHEEPQPQDADLRPKVDNAKAYEEIYNQIIAEKKDKKAKKKAEREERKRKKEAKTCAIF